MQKYSLCCNFTSVDKPFQDWAIVNCCYIFFINRHNINNIWARYIKWDFLIKVVLCLLSIAGLAILVYYKYTSSIGRLFIWKISLIMFFEKPLFGWGTSGFEKSYLYHQADYFRVNLAAKSVYKYTATDTVNAFNKYIMILVRFGVAGLCIFIYFICRIIWRIKETERIRDSTMHLLCCLY